jgi:hypothetical protein
MKRLILVFVAWRAAANDTDPASMC